MMATAWSAARTIGPSVICVQSLVPVMRSEGVHENTPPGRWSNVSRTPVLLPPRLWVLTQPDTVYVPALS